jgi:hypothetical protein
MADTTDGYRAIAKTLSKRRHSSGRKMDPFYDSFGTLAPYTPTLRENAADFVRQHWPWSNKEEKARDLTTLLDWSPFGGLADAQEAGRALGSGNIPEAIFGIASAGIPGPPLKGWGRKIFDLDYFGKPVRIWSNPEPEALKNLIAKSKYKAMRRVRDPDTGDVFVWDAGDPALHAMVAKELGLKSDESLWDIIGIDD